jgi:integrase
MLQDSAKTCQTSSRIQAREVWAMPSLGRVYRDKGDRWLIKLPKNIKIFCDKQHRAFYSKQHAEWTLNQIHGEIENGNFDSDFYAKRKKSILSFSTYAEEWLGNCERRVQRNELSVTYLGSLKNYVHNLFIPHFGNTNIMEIKGRHLKAFYLSLEYSPKSLWNIMSGLHKLFKDAVDEEVLQAMPKFPMEFRASQLPDPQWQWCDEETQEKIFSELCPDAYFMILFAATHGTRPGETRALQHGDIDLNNDMVTVQRAFADNDLHQYTKSKRIRHIPLDPTWKELYLSRPRHLDFDGFVFADANSKPHGRNWCRNQWNAARERAGVAHITLYSGTRHAIASQCANRGIAIQLISKFLGHSTLAQTQRYAHLEVNALRQVRRKAPIRAIVSKSSVTAKSGK